MIITEKIIERIAYKNIFFCFLLYNPRKKIGTISVILFMNPGNPAILKNIDLIKVTTNSVRYPYDDPNNRVEVNMGKSDISNFSPRNNGMAE